MPLDTRRLWVPESTKVPISLAKDSRKIVMLDEHGKRHDGRSIDQHRPTFMKTGTITQAKGSAYVEMNDTKVITAVYGPREVLKREDFTMSGQVKCMFKFATFACVIRQGHQQSDMEKDCSLTIQEALVPAIRLDKFPKARLEIYITVLQDGGSAMAAAVTCASMAVADAGIEMYDVVVGCAMRQFGTRSLVDPTAEEEALQDTHEAEGSIATLTVGLMPSLNQVSALVQTGQLTSDEAKQCLKLCLDTCRKLYPVVRQCLVQSIEGKMGR